jgi:uncharacterized protein (DUF1697 family)
MDELREAFEGMGFDDVATYINSGNVLFRASRQRSDALAERIESRLSKRFGIELKVVLLTESRLRAVVEAAPIGDGGFGEGTHSSDVVFLRRPLTVRRAMGVVETKDGVDRAWEGKGVVYFSRLRAKATSSRMGRMIGTPEYGDMTIRSWGTVLKLRDRL